VCCCPQIKAALQQASLAVGAINIRFPERFMHGAFTNPDPALRSEAVALAAEGCSMAVELGSDQVVVWSPYDGYDYYLQVGFGMYVLQHMQG
jgi:xylose isomerase